MAVPNPYHNLVQQLSELMDSVWRYENYYKEDAAQCPECQNLWDHLQKRHEEDIEMIKKELVRHTEEGDW